MLNHNLGGYIDMSFLSQTEEENTPFIEFGVEGSLKEDMNLDSFISCCIGKFDLPIKKLEKIYLCAFKIPSIKVYGERFALAIPIFDSNNRGLIEISTSAN